MAKNKTTETTADVFGFIQTLHDQAKQKDSLQLIEIFREQTGFEPKMWGPNIIGFGSYHYKYASGHEGDAPLAGFSPRKDALSLYFWPTFDQRDALLAQLGKHKSGKSCVYLKKLDDANIGVLSRMIVLSVKEANRLYPS